MVTELPNCRNSAPGTIWMFFLIAFLVSWAIWIPMLFLIPEKEQLPLLLLGGFGPLLSAILVTWAKEGKTALKQWLLETFRVRINLMWYLVGGLFLPFGIALLHHSAYMLSGGISAFTFNQQWGIYVARLLSTALLGGGNEEPGWRGYATPRLMMKFHPILAAFIVGVFWVIWHIPLYFGNWGGKDQPLLWMFIYAFALSIIMTWLYFQSSKSVLPVMFLHAGTNIVFGFFPRTNTIFSSPDIDFNVFKSIAYWIVAIIIIVFTKGQLGYPTKTASRNS